MYLNIQENSFASIDTSAVFDCGTLYNNGMCCAVLGCPRRRLPAHLGARCTGGLALFSLPSTGVLSVGPVCGAVGQLDYNSARQVAVDVHGLGFQVAIRARVVVRRSSAALLHGARSRPLSVVIVILKNIEGAPTAGASTAPAAKTTTPTASATPGTSPIGHLTPSPRATWPRPAPRTRRPRARSSSRNGQPQPRRWQTNAA